MRRWLKAKKQKLDKLKEILKNCALCPRRCRVNRLKGKRGYCGAGKDLEIASAGPHFGEEDVLVGRCGSGTIFLNSCNLSCVFCQNYDISQLRRGQVITQGEFVELLLSLQAKGCHNINFVTPTHFVPQIFEGVCAAQEKGLSIPLVYNCGGYEAVEVLQLLDGAVDIYMPDVKYADEATARKLSNAPGYSEVVKWALKEMHRQVGDLILNHQGLAVKGLLIRHLVLPNNLAGTASVLRFIAQEVSSDSYVNIMDQYRPCFKADELCELSRTITQEEYHQAIEIARSLGLRRGF